MSLHTQPSISIWSFCQERRNRGDQGFKVSFISLLQDALQGWVPLFEKTVLAHWTIRHHWLQLSNEKKEISVPNTLSNFLASKEVVCFDGDSPNIANNIQKLLSDNKRKKEKKNTQPAKTKLNAQRRSTRRSWGLCPPSRPPARPPTHLPCLYITISRQHMQIPQSHSYPLSFFYLIHLHNYSLTDKLTHVWEIWKKIVINMHQK